MNSTILHLNKGRLLSWLSSLVFDPVNRKNWNWYEIPEYSYMEKGYEYRAIIFINRSRDQKQIIFFQLRAGESPREEQIDSSIKFLETHYTLNGENLNSF